MYNYESEAIKIVQDDWLKVKEKYQQLMQSAFQVELTECGFADKDVVELATGKIGRISYRRNGWGNISYEFYFQAYTKKGVLSQMIHRIYGDVKLTEYFRLAEGDEIINAD